MPTYSGDPRWITARFASKCSKCAAEVTKGQQVYYFPNGRSIVCAKPECGKAAEREFEAAKADEDGY